MIARRAVMSGVCATVLVVGGYFSWTSMGQVRLLAGTQANRIEGSTIGAKDLVAAPFRVAAEGRVEPVSGQRELAIGVVGTLAAVYVDEGDRIKKGQLLAELVNGDERARVTAAESTVSLRKAELDKLLNGARPEERREAAARAERARAGVALAQQELARRRPLAASGVSSQQQLEQAVSATQVAEADSNASQAALELINAPPRVEDVAIANANLALAEANLKEQQASLEKTQLRSPIDGVVLRRYLKTGETISIQPLIPVLQVADTDHLRVRAEVDETDVGRIKLGQRAWVTTSAYPNQQFGGVIERISERMGRKTVHSDEPTDKKDTNVLDVLVDLTDHNARLPTGLRVNVFVEPPSITQN